MKATDLDRYGCILGGRRITYRKLLDRYVCNGCGGRIAHTFNAEGDHLFCGMCRGEDFVSEHAYLAQVIEGFEVLRSLPSEIQALYADEDEQPQGAKQAVAELFG